ncbi:MAG: FHA domain-containing protein [Chthoniobacterales bacterium]|jgi:pSer/pThr/pTyr-binding forkhead associated (FHA) protein
MRLTVYFPEDSPTTHEFVGNKLTVGRLGDNDVQLDDGSVSSHHGEILLREGAAVLVDKDSTNGTFLNGEQVKGECPLSEGDEIYFGSVRGVFMQPAQGMAQVEVAAETVTAAAEGTGRPANFHYMSPLPRPAKPKDILGVVAWACAGVGALGIAYALVSILG